MKTIKRFLLTGSVLGVIVTGALAALLLAPRATYATEVELLDDPNFLRAEIVEIDPATVRSWTSVKRGEEIDLPWFEGSRLVAIAERTEETGKFVSVVAVVEADVIGNVILAIGDDVTGSVTIDTEGYRLRSLGEGNYSLTQVDTGSLMPATPDTAGSQGFVAGQYEQPQIHPARPSIGALPPRELFEMLKADLDKGPDAGLFENGTRIDVLVAYSREAASWVSASGSNIDAEIVTMIGRTNIGLAHGGIIPRLRLVGTTEVIYSVVDSAKLQGDLVNLEQGVGNLAALHTLRDSTSADLVSLLVFNGTDKCGDGKPGCGWATTSNNLAGPGDNPGTFLWEQNFASNGYSVVSIYQAINADTFMHEVGHNLGAHHDWYTYVTNPSAPTADVFAHGWVMIQIPFPARTVMSYSSVCAVQVPKLTCELLPVFSTPLRSYFGVRLGDPAPGTPATLLGPADNATAINNMAQTVSSYRVSAP